MPISYKKLWKLLIDLGLKKKDLKESAHLTGHAMNKLSRDEAVTTDTLGKICQCLNCKVDDIMEFVPEESENG